MSIGHERTLSSLREPLRGPSIGTLFKERLKVIHRRQRLVDAVGRSPWRVSTWLLCKDKMPVKSTSILNYILFLLTSLD